MISTVRDWEQFLSEVTWFLSPGDSAVVGTPREWSRGPVADLPELSGLLAEATVTSVTVGTRGYELLAWGPENNRRGWLCNPPESGVRDQVAAAHRSFWSVNGGIVERFNEPATWWNNQNEVLTATAARTAPGPILFSYSWIWHDDGLAMPIDADAYYVAAIEANGNLTLVHPHTSQVLLFAPDHAFAGVTPLAGCPPFSLLTIDGVPDLATWIESCAGSWRVA